MTVAELRQWLDQLPDWAGRFEVIFYDSEYGPQPVATLVISTAADPNWLGQVELSEARPAQPRWTIIDNFHKGGRQ